MSPQRRTIILGEKGSNETLNSMGSEELASLLGELTTKGLDPRLIEDIDLEPLPMDVDLSGIDINYREFDAIIEAISSGAPNFPRRVFNNVLKFDDTQPQDKKIVQMHKDPQFELTEEELRTILSSNHSDKDFRATIDRIAFVRQMSHYSINIGRLYEALDSGTMTKIPTIGKKISNALTTVVNAKIDELRAQANSWLRPVRYVIIMTTLAGLSR